MPRSMDDVLPWLILKSIPGVGNVLFKRLIEEFEAPNRVLAAPSEALSRVAGISSSTARAIRRHTLSDSVKQECDLICQKTYQFIPITSPDYPPLLRQIHDPPPYLYAMGQLGETDLSVAVVGARNATSYGISAANRLCRALAERQLCVISGMARGIDTAAHNGALAGNGRTVAVLGSGLENIYPKENRGLARRIAENGAVLSEFPLRAAPEAHHFPARNRIISGISLGTVVVEAAAKSGSLITARMALEQNREVFAVPGSIASAKSSGTHGLIKQGAKLVENAQDIIDELGPVTGHRYADPAGTPISGASDAGLSAEDRQVIRALAPYPAHIDELARQLSIPAGILSGTLLKLELLGIVRQHPGRFFQIIQPSP